MGEAGGERLELPNQTIYPLCHRVYLRAQMIKAIAVTVVRDSGGKVTPTQCFRSFSDGMGAPADDVAKPKGAKQRQNGSQNDRQAYRFGKGGVEALVRSSHCTHGEPCPVGQNNRLRQCVHRFAMR